MWSSIIPTELSIELIYTWWCNSIPIFKNKLQYIKSLLRLEQVCLTRQHFERSFSHHRNNDRRSISQNVAYLSIYIKYIYSRRNELIILWTLNRQAKIFLRIEFTLKNSTLEVIFLRCLVNTYLDHTRHVCLPCLDGL